MVDNPLFFCGEWVTGPGNVWKSVWLGMHSTAIFNLLPTHTKVTLLADSINIEVECNTNTLMRMEHLNFWKNRTEVKSYVEAMFRSAN